MIRIHLVILAVVSSCISEKQPRSPRCPAGIDAKTGACRPPTTDLVDNELCIGNFQLQERANRCVFHTAEQDECRVKGLSSERRVSGGCYVRDTDDQKCELNDVNTEKFVCERSIKAERAPVKVYLEVTKQGLTPKVIFEEQVEEGAELTIKEQHYVEKDLLKKDREGETQLTIPLKIPWQIEYRRKSDKESFCADGHLEGHNTTREKASQGSRCL